MDRVLTPPTPSAIIADMPERYRVVCQIHSEREPTVETLREWTIAETDADLLTASGRWQGSNGESLEISESALEDLWLWSARWQLPPRGADGDRWIVELRLAQQSGPLEFEAVVRNSDMRQRAPRSLGVARQLIERHDCRHGELPLLISAQEVTADQAEAFSRERLCNERRQLPLIAISRDRRGRCARDPDSVQRALAGRALVAVWDSDVSAIATRPLGDKLGCHPGAVRVYRPRPTSGDHSFDHPFTRWQEAQRGGFSDLLREQVRQATPAEALLSPCADIAERLQRAERLALQAQVAELRATLDGSANVTTRQADSMQELLERQQARIADLEADNQRLREINERLDQAVDTFAQHQAEAGSSPFDDPESIAEAVLFALGQCPSLNFFESASASADDSRYRGPEEVLSALKRLNDTAARMARGEVAEPLLLGELGKLGLTVSDESADTMHRYADERRFRNSDGELVEMPMHIKLGGGSGADSRCRIHFRWDGSTGKIEVGHVGRHLQTGRS